MPRADPAILKEVVRTEDLKWRPSHTADYRSETEALTTLARTMAEEPQKIFQGLVDLIRPLCRAGSAGISLSEEHEGQSQFRWVATSGEFAPLRNATLPRSFSPCGVVLDENTPQLMVRPERAYPYINDLKIPVEEVLLVPFYNRGVPIGTVWVATHDNSQHFDREDLRITTSLSQFAALAVQAMARSSEVESGRQAASDEERERLRVVDELSQVKQRLDAALLASEISLYEWDVPTNRVDGDDNFYRIFGEDLRATPEHRLQQFTARIHADDLPEVMKRIQRTLETGEHYEADYRVVRDGREIWVRARGRITFDSTGKPSHFTGVLVDINDRKRAEIERRDAEYESERLTKIYETVLSSTEDFAYIWDTRGRFVYANRSLQRLYGKTLAEIVGKNFYELGYPTWHADMHMREIAQVIATKQPFRGEVPFTGGSGISGIYDYIFMPVLGKNGEVEFIAGTTRDESERRRRVDRDQLLIALDDATRPMTDAQEITQKSAQLLGKQLAVNRCAYAHVHEDQNTFDILGDYNFRVPSIVGRYRFDQFGEECVRQMHAGEPFIVEDTFADPRTASVRDAFVATQIRSVICVPLHKAGRFVAGMAVHQTTPRLWQPHEVEMLVSVANRCWESIERTRVTRELADRERDLQNVVQELATAQRGLEQHANVLEQTVAERTARLQETVSELEAFSYSVSHDLRGPLRVMRSFAQALQEDCGAELNVLGQDYIRRIVTAAGRMDQVIQDVLEYSLLVRNELPIEPIALEGFLVGLLEGYPEFEHAEIVVESPLPVVLGNTAALTQCFANLIGNALKFVAPGTTPLVRIYGEADDKTAHVHIEDNGIGIEKSMQDKIFGAFYRLDTTYEGTGIGLAIVRKAIDRMGGTVTVDSQPGHGSTFHLHLPIAREDAS
ncbi:ATP-binding protein [Oleiharenicola lentus]|uniref:ATP-binding protein n=1 Tax=Oleiharenicola lentus TaxID=2508720 RepID=UPI003F662740